MKGSSGDRIVRGEMGFCKKERERAREQERERESESKKEREREREKSGYRVGEWASGRVGAHQMFETIIFFYC